MSVLPRKDRLRIVQKLYTCLGFSGRAAHVRPDMLAAPRCAGLPVRKPGVCPASFGRVAICGASPTSDNRRCEGCCESHR